MQAIYRWNGEYFGFIRGDRLFDADGNYIGWLTEDGRVWTVDGSFLGELVDGEYVLRRLAMVPPVPRIPQIPPIPPIPLVPRVDRTGRVPRSGWVDVLDAVPS